MVKLPDASDLGYVGPSRVTPNVNIPTNPIPQALAGFGNVLQNTGGTFLAIDKKRRDEQLAQQNLVDVGKAEADWADSQLKGEQTFKYDNDYPTMQQRASDYTDKERNRIGAGIRNPKMRERWLATTQERSARFKGWAADHAGALEHTDNQNGTFKTAEALSRIYRDPASTPEMKATVLKESEAMRDLAYKTGLINSDQKDAWDKQFIEGAKFIRAQLETKNGQNVVGGGEISIADIPAEGARLLNVISSKEAGSYNVMNGGEKFDTNGPHPNRVGAGGTSTAAGKYQFIKSTWDMAVKALGLDGRMTPENQDRAAWWNAQRAYKERTGGKFDLVTDLKSGSASAMARIKRVLGGPDPQHGEWTGLQNIKDEDFVKQVSGGKTTFTRDTDLANAPDYVKDLSPEQQQSLVDLWESEKSKRSVEDKTNIAMAEDNGPAAMQNTGSYTGYQPTLEDYVGAYGPAAGAQKFAAYQSSMQTAGQVHDFQQMPKADIDAAVQAAVPTSSGDDAALQADRYKVLSQAREATLKAREEDPAGYVQQAIPDVKAKWDAVRNAVTPEDGQAAMSAAMTATSEAEKHLGIQNVELLPKDVAHNAAAATKDESLSFTSRINPAVQLMAGTNDPEQRKAIFNQMVKEGMPDRLEAAFRAQERGDTAAAEHLFRAGMTDQSKLPKSDIKDTEILSQWQTDWVDENTPGDIFYGFNGAPDDTVTYERDRQLVLSAVKIEMAINGKDLQSAVATVGKEIFGDVHVVNDSNVQILASSKPDAPPDDYYTNNLIALMPRWHAAAVASGNRITGDILPEGAGDPTSQRAISNAAAQNNADQIMAEGFVTNYGNDGYIFIDTLHGGYPIAGPDGEPLVFTKADFQNAGGRPSRFLRSGQAPQIAPQEPAVSSSTEVPNDPNSPGAVYTAKRMGGSEYPTVVGIRG